MVNSTSSSTARDHPVVHLAQRRQNLLVPIGAGGAEAGTDRLDPLDGIAEIHHRDAAGLQHQTDRVGGVSDLR
jgi:hypothetical protein